ncbi:hypothetical protein E1258_31695, partial [Micromonospora sp. KC207]
MSEAGQPGAATPGEHGDGTGQQDDLARSVSGWAPSATGWSGGGAAGGPREAASGWGRAEPASGWGASSPRHGDLPAPLPGLAAGAESSPRVNGHPHVNGVSHAGEESQAGRPAPVSAPPLAGDSGREADGDRLAVPAQRPAPTLERPADPPRGGDPDPGAARHFSDDQPAPRAGRWSDGNVPASAPPAGQVPPVGPAASGFEVPPGFHAPTADRAVAEQSASARGPYDWADRFPPEEVDPRGYPTAADASGVPHLPGGDRGGRFAPTEGAEGQSYRPPGPPEPARAGYPAESDHYPAYSAEPDRGGHPGDDRATRGRDENAAPPPPGWAGSDWNSPSWGGGWAPPWARGQGEPIGHRSHDDEGEPARRARDDEGEPARRARDDEAAGRRSRDDDEDAIGRRIRDDELAGRRERAEAEPVGPSRATAEQADPPPHEGRAVDWAPRSGRGYPPEPSRPYAAEPIRPYEPVRAEPIRPYQPVRAEPVRPYELARPGSEPRPGGDQATRPAAPEPAERPGWAGG